MITDKRMAEIFSKQAEHWEACYWRLMGQKKADGKIVPGHVATPPDTVRELARRRAEVVVLRAAIRDLLRALDTAEGAPEIAVAKFAAAAVIAKVGADAE